MIVSDLKGGLVQWNRAALTIHGYTKLEEGLRSQSDLVDTFELSTLDGIRVPLEEWPLFRILRGENLRDLELRVRNIRADWERIFNYGGSRSRWEQRTGAGDRYRKRHYSAQARRSACESKLTSSIMRGTRSSSGTSKTIASSFGTRERNT